MTNIQDGNFRHNNMPVPQGSRVLPLFSLAGRTAIVSGAGAGIGLAVAEALAEAGANVAIWYNTNKQAVTEAERLEQTFKVKCRAYQVDVTSIEAVEKLMGGVVREFNGRLDIFIANAGVVCGDVAFIDSSADVTAHTVAVNLQGVMWCAKVAGAYFRRQKKESTNLEGEVLDNYLSGSFVATASMSGSVVNIPQLQASYNASKAAVIQFCKSIAIEWTGFARVNTVSPGYTQTQLTSFADADLKHLWNNKTPMGRECRVSELKGAYLYLASDASSYTSGLDMIVDGGYSLP
ncbi:unnamed protein product [Clonostachys rosea]|uniref:L-xylulose reductase n=1 Tax=Bionectria ochroleuca TaxID=29856 RepID=A0ABY6UJG4_BIOOC|nr:unnamed protein product [Clonostachys rosea]